MSDAIVPIDVPSGPHRAWVGAGALHRVGAVLDAAGVRAPRVVVVHDAGVPEDAVSAVAASLVGTRRGVERVPVVGGESAKTLETVSDVARRLLDLGVDRSWAMVVVGGGLVGDLAGFVAATYMRGMDAVLVPTTLLAMVDASVGGKTAVNLPRADGTLAKNIIGAFRQPRAVVCDPEVLGTLPGREFRSGLAECVKHAVIAEPGLLVELVERRDALVARDPAMLAALVARNVRIKAAVVAGDEREEGGRERLNLGHTFAHAIESIMHDCCTHGEAVAIGTVAACRLAAELEVGDGREEELEAAVRGTLESLGLPVRIPGTAAAASLRAAMSADKKRRGEGLRLVVPFAPGDVRTVGDVPVEAIDAAWRAVGAG